MYCMKYSRQLNVRKIDSERWKSQLMLGPILMQKLNFVFRYF